MSATLGGSPTLDGLRIQVRVVRALFLRELATRFGRDNLGYLWLFVEPAMLGSAIGSIHVATGHFLPGNPNVFVFWVVAYLPLYLFRSLINRAPNGITANQSMLYHRRVTLLDIMVARSILEIAAVVGALVVFTLFFGMAMGEWPVYPAEVMGGLVLLGLLSHGMAMMIAAGSVATDLFERVTHLFSYLSMPLIGALFMVDWLPREVQEQALLIPTVHCFELIRHGQFGTKLTTHYDLWYVGAWIIVLNVLGMLALRIARRHMVL